MNSPVPTGSEAKKGLLLVGHGTRDASGVAELRTLTQQVAALCPAAIVEACFLELVEPSIEAGLGRLVGRGVREATVVPLMLQAAGHVKRDIPRAVASAAASHPDLVVRQTAHLGSHPRVLELSVLRYREALARHGEPATCDDQTMLLVVGRGSRDPEAAGLLAEFARRRHRVTPSGWTEVAYMAMDEPSVEQALGKVAGRRLGRVVVQPHLLFRGCLLQRLERQVAEAAERFSKLAWIVTEHLGPHQLITEAVISVAENCGEK